MKILDSLYAVWKDLEKSYENMHENLKVDNRKDFLYKLCGFDGKQDNIDGLKSALSKESSSYTDDEFDTYAELVRILDAIKLAINAGIKDIEDLNTFSCIALNIVEGSNDNVKHLSDDFFNKYFSSGDISLNKMPPDDIFRLVGEFKNTVTLDERGQAKYYYCSPLDCDGIYNLYSLNDLQSLIESFRKGTANADAPKILSAIKHITKGNKYDTALDCVFLANNYYMMQDDGEVKLLLNNKSYKVKNVIETKSYKFNLIRVKCPSGYATVVLLP